MIACAEPLHEVIVPCNVNCNVAGQSMGDIDGECQQSFDDLG